MINNLPFVLKTNNWKILWQVLRSSLCGVNSNLCTKYHVIWSHWCNWDAFVLNGNIVSYASRSKISKPFLHTWSQWPAIELGSVTSRHAGLFWVHAVYSDEHRKFSHARRLVSGVHKIVFCVLQKLKDFFFCPCPLRGSVGM